MGLLTLSATVVLMILSIGTTNVRGVHFRGGTARWAPIPGAPTISHSDGRPSKIRVQFDVSFKLNDTDNVEKHRQCTETLKEARTELKTRGDIQCQDCYSYNFGEGLVVGPAIQRMKWVCNDFNPVGDYAAGSYAFDLDIASNTYEGINKFIIFNEEECWVKPVTPPGNENCQKWKIMTVVDLTRRTDNGRINSSPIVPTLPIQQAYEGCDYTLDIQVSDPDEDRTECRMTSDKEGDFECPSHGTTSFRKNEVCGDLERVTIYKNCTLKFNTHGASGNYAIRLMIEDFDGQNNPLSKVSLSFLLYVNPDTSHCDAPKVWSHVCQLAHIGNEIKVHITAEAANGKSIQRIDTVKPYGMKSSVLKPDAPNPDHPLQKYVTLTWTPTSLGRYTVTFQATDSRGFQSVSGSMIIHVVDTDIELQFYPIEEGSWPEPGEQSEGWHASSVPRWKINFNKNIKRPTEPAFIKFVEFSSSKVLHSIDVSSSDDVEFKRRAIRFTPGPVFPEDVEQVYVELADGIAVLAENDCIRSTHARWLYLAAITPTEAPPISYKCTSYTAGMPSYEEDECFLRAEPVVATANDNVSLSYKRCCPGNCPGEEDVDQQQGRGDFPGGYIYY